MGLLKIFIFSAFSGISIALTYLFSGENAEIGFTFTILNILYENVEPSSQVFVLIISLIVTIFFVYGLSKFMREIIEQKLKGIVIASLGLSGSILVLLSTENSSYMIFLGTSSLIIGIIFLSLNRKAS